MTDTGTAAEKAKVVTQADSQPPQYSQTTVLPPDPNKPGCIMDEPTYDRIQRRIKKETGRLSAPIWLGAAFACFGVGMSALLAYLVLPDHTKGLPAGAETIIAGIAIISGALFVGFCIAFGFAVHHGNETAKDICDEMNTHTTRHIAAIPTTPQSRADTSDDAPQPG
ncbi:MAG: hypothetical protein ACYDA2_08175 [Acidimicrobiales bacterium]